jgi:ABC-type bacteriocin/lantibiotic exporter with double-glycine peptidase domain
LNLIIGKNDKILISGASGSGKSTFLDILTGLIRPNKGKIIIDGRTLIGKNNLNLYQKKISLIDQNIFIEEGSLLKNITKSDNASEVNQELLIKCCKIAELDDLIKKNKDKYKMYLSHLGTNLSGGQKQRIAIARSIYNNRDILILDETTSEIDPKTENKIFNNFNKYLKDKTILMITHRTKKINFFTKKFELKNNKLKKIY